MTKNGTRANVLFAVIGLLTMVSQLKKASEGSGFAIVLSVVAALLFVAATIGAVRSSRQSRQ